MLIAEFPLTGLLSDIVLIIEWIMCFLFLEMGIYFLIKSKRKRKALRNLQENAYIFLFTGYFLMWIFIIIADFYIVNELIRTTLLNLGFSLEVLSLVLFITFIEKVKNFLKRYFFSSIALIFMILYVISILFLPSLAAYISSFFWIVFGVFFSLYLKEIYTDFYINRNLGQLKYNFVEIILGVILVVLGYQLTTRVVTMIFGIYIRLVGDILQIAGVGLIALFYLSVPSFSEYDWQEKIESLILSHNSGLLIFSSNFRKDEDKAKSSLLSAALSSLEIMLEEIIQKKELSVLEKDDRIIIIYPGKYTYGIIIAEEDLKSLHILLERFVKRIEKVYSKILEKWNGDLRILKPIKHIKDEIFFNK